MRDESSVIHALRARAIASATIIRSVFCSALGQCRCALPTGIAVVIVLAALTSSGVAQATAPVAESASPGAPLASAAESQASSQSYLAARAAQSLKNLFPQSLHSPRFLTLEAWQWVGLGSLGLFALIAARIVRIIVSHLARRAAAKRHVLLNPESIRRVVAPLGVLVGASMWMMGLPALELSPGLTTSLVLAARFAATFSGVLVAVRLVDLTAEGVKHSLDKRGFKVNSLIYPLLTRTVKIVLLGLGVIYLADALNIQVLPLVTGLGIGGLAMALAAKDTVENLFGSVSVIIDQPFRVGDTVRIGDVEGVVEMLGLRATRVRTPRGALVTIPNASLVRANVENRGRMPMARMVAMVSVRCDTPAESLTLVAKRIDDAARRDTAIIKDDLSVTLSSGNPGRVDISVHASVDLSDGQTEPSHRQRMFLEMVRVCETTGVKLA